MVEVAGHREADWAVDLRGVRKVYGRDIEALAGVDIRAGSGEIFGLLGPNGAGKSTLVKIMMTVVRPDQASGTVLGQPIGHRRTMVRIGYLPEAHRFPPYLTGLQLLDYYAALAKVGRSVRRRRGPMLLDRLGLKGWGDRKISTFSKGMLQRLGIAQALMNDPGLLVLDEPTDGLDPIGRRDVRELLLDLRSQHKTIFLNSHLLGELEQVCDRVVILVSGKVARQGRLSELMAERLEFRIVAEGDLSGLGEKIERLGGRIDGDTITLDHQDIAKVNEVIDLLRSRRHLVRSATGRRFSLEDIFVDAMAADQTATGPIPTAKPAAREGA